MQIDGDGQHNTLISEIAAQKRDESTITKENCFKYTKSGNRVVKKTTYGWYLLVSWKDGCNSWFPLKYLRVSNPIEISEYTVTHNLTEELDFHRWVLHTLR